MSTVLPPPLPIGGGYVHGPAQAYARSPSHCSTPASRASSGRSQGLRNTGKLISAGAGAPSSTRSSAASIASSAEHNRVDHGPPAPPSARTGLMFSQSAPSLTPRDVPADKVASMKNVHLRRRNAKPEAIPKAVWSDSNLHLEKDEWPAHGIPLWVFHGKDRPRPGFKEEVRFTVREEKYINYCVRMRCGVGDHFNGGTVGLVYSPDQTEAVPGTEGQLITIIDTVAQPNNTLTITAVGDVAFRVKSAWMPRGMMGLQLAHIEAAGQAETLDTIIDTCATEPELTVFARLMAAVPDLAELMRTEGPFTAFVPTNESFRRLGFTEEELLARPDLGHIVACHIHPGRTPCEAMYSGRTWQALDGTIQQVAFRRWPRGNAAVNEVPIEFMDIHCSNGLVHSICGMIKSCPAPNRRRQ